MRHNKPCTIYDRCPHYTRKKKISSRPPPQHRLRNQYVRYTYIKSATVVSAEHVTPCLLESVVVYVQSSDELVAAVVPRLRPLSDCVHVQGVLEDRHVVEL